MGLSVVAQRFRQRCYCACAVFGNFEFFCPLGCPKNISGGNALDKHKIPFPSYHRNSSLRQCRFGDVTTIYSLIYVFFVCLENCWQNFFRSSFRVKSFDQFLCFCQEDQAKDQQQYYPFQVDSIIITDEVIPDFLIYFFVSGSLL